jgi:tetratricopeptide (TPR) repeat protein
MASNPSLSVTDLLKDLDMMAISVPQGSNPPPVGQELNSLCTRIESLAISGHFLEAYNLELAQLHTLLKVCGEEEEKAIRSLENLSSFCFELGQHEKAARLLDRVIALRTKVNGAADSTTLAAIASKVAALQKAGQMQQAELLGGELVTKCVNGLGMEDPATLRAMSNLASIYCSKGDDQNAQILFELVLRTRKKVLPPDDMDTVRAMVNLAGVYFSQERWTEAAVQLQSVLTIRRRVYGDEHEMTIKIVRMLEKAYKELKRWSDLLPLQQLAVDVMRKNFGEAHPETAEARLKLMLTYMCLQAWETAMRIADEVIKTLENTYPAGHPLLDQMQEHIGMLKSHFSNQKEELKLALKAVYQPLNTKNREIRLINIKKAPAASPMHCELVVTSLDEALPFQALSYTWGLATENRQLNLHGSAMNITNNLWHALTQLRSTVTERLLWVDAVSINQMDIQERSSQVQLMRDIYSEATCTLVWLGEEKDDSQIAMCFLKELETSTSPVKIALRALQDSLQNPLINALESLFTRREYWNRLWVVQEVICAKDAVVHCGTESIRYETISNFFTVFAESGKNLGDAALLRRLESLLYKFGTRGPAKLGKPTASGTVERKSLLRLLNAYRNADCTDPKDRVYALLGISLYADHSHPGLQIDYSKSVAEVYQGAAQAIIEESGKLDVLCMNHESTTHPETGQYRARHHSLPSWTPDWSTILGSLPLASIPSAEKRASGDLRARVKFSPDGIQITAEGACFFEIDYTTDLLSSSRTKYHDMLRTLLGWRMYAQLCLGILPGSSYHERLDTFHRLITLEIPEYEHLTHQNNWWISWERALQQKKPIAELEITPPQKLYLQHIFDYCVGRRMLCLDDPLDYPSTNSSVKAVGGIRLGLCPQETKKGDLLVVLWGCDFPVILRQQDDHYIFIGEAFVPEYMNGKAVEQEKQGILVSQKFEIH